MCRHVAQRLLIRLLRSAPNDNVALPRMLNGTSVYPRVKTSVLLIKAPDHVKRSSGGISEAVDPPQPFRDLVPTGQRGRRDGSTTPAGSRATSRRSMADRGGQRSGRAR